MGRNSLSNKLKVGILGGMGPEATVECYKSIIDQTPADTDQEHLPIVIVNNPQIPDRTEAILYDGDSPVPALQDSARVLEGAGADFVIMPCNTAHHFVSEVEEAIEVPILNMIKATIDQLEPGSTVGLLATTGTIKTEIYERYSQDKVEIVTPSEKDQEIVMDVIYGKKGIKAGYKNQNLTDELVKVAGGLNKRGAQATIAACTEIRLVLDDSDLDEHGLKLWKPIDIISKEAIALARQGGQRGQWTR